MDRVIIIAEIGECFNGDMDTAKKLIACAREAGCDIVKFQTLDYENISETDPEKDWFKKVALSPERIRRLIRFSDEAGIQVLFTPENIKTATWLLDEALTDIKIASSSLADGSLIKFINNRFTRVFISTGMASINEVKMAVRGLKDIQDLYIMHCISEYPTGPLLEQRGLKALANKDVRLNMMKILTELFPGHKIGYSDHTAGILAPIAAVAAGAKVIEKHITFDRKIPVERYLKNREYLGTDHVLSLEPSELKEMVRQVREVEAMFWDKGWERTEAEKILIKFLRGRFSA